MQPPTPLNDFLDFCKLLENSPSLTPEKAVQLFRDQPNGAQSANHASETTSTMTGSDDNKITSAVDRLKAFRGTLAGVTIDEILQSRHEGHRY